MSEKRMKLKEHLSLEVGLRRTENAFVLSILKQEDDENIEIYKKVANFLGSCSSNDILQILDCLEESIHKVDDEERLLESFRMFREHRN